MFCCSQRWMLLVWALLQLGCRYDFNRIFDGGERPEGGIPDGGGDAAAPGHEWAITGPDHSAAHAIAVSGGAVYVAGDYAGTLLAKGTNLTTESQPNSNTKSSDGLLLKLDAASGAVEWGLRLGGAGNDTFSEVVAGPGSEVFVLGQLDRATGPSDDGDASISWANTKNAVGMVTPKALNRQDNFVARVEADGTLTWIAVAVGNTPGLAHHPDGIAQGGGRVFAVGNITTNTTFYGADGAACPSCVVDPSGTKSDLFIACYDAKDGKALWVEKVGEANIATTARDVIMHAGALYVAGDLAGSGTVSFDKHTVTPRPDPDALLAKCTPTTSGCPFDWAKHFPVVGTGQVFGVAADPSQSPASLLVTGGFGGTIDFPTSASSVETLTAKGDSDIFLARLSSGGDLQWARQAGSEMLGMPVNARLVFDHNELGSRVAADPAGNAYVTGHFFGKARFESFTLASPAGSNQAHAFVARFDGASKGAVTSQPQTSAGKTDGESRGEDVVVSGNCTYAVGNYRSHIVFPSDPLGEPGNFTRFFVWKHCW